MTSLGRLWHNPMRKESDPLQCRRYAIGFMRRGRFLELDLSIEWRVKQDEEEYKEKCKYNDRSFICGGFHFALSFQYTK